MIKIERGNRPKELTDDFVRIETEKFKADHNKTVWNKNWLKESLLSLSHGKCAYCESDLTTPGSYMEIEHFKNKDDFPDDVLNWDNLLPSCKTCNDHKSNHNVVNEPIVNPFVDTPSNHLYMWLYFYKGRDAKGKKTIEVLDLNELSRHVKARSSIGSSICSQLENLLQTIQDGLTKKGAATRFKNKVRGLMKECLPEKKYSAVCATVLLSCQEFHQIKEQMTSLKLWDNEFQNLLDRITAIALLPDTPSAAS